MARKLMIYVLGIAFILCNLFFFVNTSFASNDYTRDDYYGLKYVKLDTSEKAESEEPKKDETRAQGGETKGKMNVYFCGCYGDEWKQPVGEPVHEKCPICGMGTKETGCGNLLKTE
jgi:hypothetical protein